MTFEDTLTKINELDFSDNKTYYACDCNNPKNYMEITSSLETHEDRQFVNTEFKVFNNGEQQKCDVFPHGKFTHFSKADGSNSTNYGADHWDEMKKQMKEKGGFNDDMLLFSDFQSYQNFVNTKATEQETSMPASTDEVNPQISAETEKIFEKFQSAQTDDQNIKIAKQQDIINALNEKISKIKTSQKKQKQTVTACEALLKSNAYPKLNPLITAFSDKTKNSAEKKNDRIKKLNKKVKKANKKIKKLKKKRQQGELLKSFISSLLDPSTDKSAYIIGMQALKEDSLMRAERKLDKTEDKLSKAQKALKSGQLNNVQLAKINARITKLTDKKSELQTKINNLNELDQSLNKLAKSDILDYQFNEIVEVTKNNSVNGSTVNEVIDNIVDKEVTNTISKAVTGEVKEATKSSSVNEETVTAPDEEIQKETSVEQIQTQQATQEPTTNTTAKQKQSSFPDKKSLRKKDGLSEKEVTAILNAGIPIHAVKKPDNTITIIFDKSQAEQIDQAIASTKIQAIKM